MTRPVLLKIGGSILAEKGTKPRFRKTVARRLLSEAAKSDVPLVVLHGAGAFGHPQAKRHAIGERPVTPERRAAISEVLAAVGLLHAEVVHAANEAGLRPVSVPLHIVSTSASGEVRDLPIERIQRLLEEGHTPIIGGTLVRDDRLGWRVLGADEVIAMLAAELSPRLAIFASDVEGVFDKPPGRDAKLLPIVRIADLDTIDAGAHPDDVTGGMRGKLEQALCVAAECPTWIVSGMVRGRVLDVLKGKAVTGTRLEA